MTSEVGSTFNSLVALYTYSNTSLELMELEIPTMSNLAEKLEDVVLIVGDWATNIVHYKLEHPSQEIGCLIEVHEGSLWTIGIKITLDGIPIEEIPDEYVVEFDKCMPELVQTLSEALELNFSVKFTAANYLLSDLHEELRNKAKGDNSSFTLGTDAGWYRIAKSDVNIGKCSGYFSIDSASADEIYQGNVMFTALTAYGSDGTMIQQIHHSSKNCGITKARLVYNSSYVGKYAYIDVYKAFEGEFLININVFDGTGWELYDESTVGTIPSGYANDEVTFTSGGLIATGVRGLNATVDELNTMVGINTDSKVQEQIDGKSPTNHASDADTYGLSTADKYGHSKSGAATPLENGGSGSAGTTIAEYSRVDHVHPITKVDGTLVVGEIPIECIPKAALERLIIVENTAARFALTKDIAQNGDTVKEEDTGHMYFIIDDDKLDSEDGYTPYTATAASSVPWSGVTGKPAAFTPTSHAVDTDTYGLSTETNYGHAKASSTTPLANGVASIGTEVNSFARGDHVHPGSSIGGRAYLECNTAVDVAEKTASIVGFTLEKGTEVLVNFVNGNTATDPTLNIGETGAKDIYYGTYRIQDFAANNIYAFIYDGTNYVCLSSRFG